MSYPNKQRIQAAGGRAGRGRRGQAIVMVTLSLTFIMGVLGLVLDVGWMHYVKQSEQAAADAGATSAAFAAEYQFSHGTPASNFCPSGTCAISATSFTSCSSVTNAGDPAYTACQYAIGNGFPASAVQVAEGLNSAPLSGGSATPAYWAEVLITQKVNQLFSWIGGRHFGSVSAFATAALSSTSTACVTVLGNTDLTGNGTLYVSGQSSLTAPCGLAVAYSGGDAITAGNDGSTVSSGGINDCGGEVGSVTSTTGTNNHKPAGCSPAVTDPLAGLPLPTVGGNGASEEHPQAPCGSHPDGSNGNLGGTTISTTGYVYNYNSKAPGSTVRNDSSNPIILDPGVYCGGLRIDGAVVQFQTGTYVINGGQLYMKNAYTVVTNQTGGVTFFLTSYNNGSYTSSGYQGFMMGDNSASIVLHAPTSGDYQGVLIFQDPGAVTQTVAGSAATSTINAALSTDVMDGQIYLPTTELLISGQPKVTGITGLDVMDLVMNGNSSLTVDNHSASSSHITTVAMIN